MRDDFVTKRTSGVILLLLANIRARRCLTRLMATIWHGRRDSFESVI
jgi:hypothetical protein